MFCLYCGTKLPDDSIFCNVCGKRQSPVESSPPATNINILPMPPLAGTSMDIGQQPDVNVPSVQGTPSRLESSPGQIFAHSAAHPAPSASLAPTHDVGQQTQPAIYPHHEQHAEPSHYSHPAHANMMSDSARIAGHISRRAILLGLTGVATVVVVGGGITWAVLSQRHGASSSTTTSITSTQPLASSPTIPPAAVVNLEYSTNLDSWGINYDRPSAISLSTTSSANNWTLPPARGIQRLYGTASFGDNLQVGVIVDRLSDTSANNPYYDAEVVFNFSGGTNFSNQPTYTSSGNGSQPIEFTINYSNGSHQKFAIAIYTDAGSVNGTPTYFLSYFRACVRQGTARLNGVNYPIAITSENNDGIYSNLDAVDVTLDLNGNGTFEDNEHFSASKPFVLNGTTYAIRSIAPDGSSMTIIKA